MAKDPSLFSSLDCALKNNFFVANDFVLHITSHGDVTFRCGQIIDMFHVPSFSANLLSVSQLTQIKKIVELFLD